MVYKAQSYSFLFLKKQITGKHVLSEVFNKKKVTPFCDKEYFTRTSAKNSLYFILSINATLSIMLINTMPAKKMIMESQFFALVLLTLKSK